jgi:hypothetical protein
MALLERIISNDFGLVGITCNGEVLKLNQAHFDMVRWCRDDAELENAKASIAEDDTAYYRQIEVINAEGMLGLHFLKYLRCDE